MYYEGFNQFLVMMYKGFLLRKRHYVVTAFEIIIPLLVACPIVIIIANQPQASPDRDLHRYRETSDYQNATFYSPFNPFTTYSSMQNILVLYMPNNTRSAKLLDEAVKIYKNQNPYSSRISLHAFNDEAVLEQFGAIIQGKNPSISVVGTVFLNLGDNNPEFPKSLDYKIRCGNRFGYDTFFLKSKYSMEIGPRHGSEYKDSMFLSWQASIEQAFIAVKSKKSEMNGDYRVQMNRFPYPPYDRSSPGAILIELIHIYIAYGFVIYFCVLVKRVVVEKANHSKELLKMMGMSDCTYWNSVFWNSFLFGAIIMLAITIMYTVPLQNSAKVFNNVNFGLLYMIFLLYLASTVLFCLAVTTFFNRPNVAVCIFLILHSISHDVLMSFYFIPGSPSTAFSDLNASSKLAICLLPNGAIQMVFRILAACEGPGGLGNYCSLTQQIYYPDIVLGEILCMMLVSCFVYILIIWYVDAVWPWQFGVPKPVYFPFTKSYWFGTTEKSSVDSWDPQNEYFERDPDGTTPGIVIRNLTKVFKVGHVRKKAVDNMSLNIYSGEITALLGRNGAGKTTAINILTGLFLPTRGSASINGYDIRTNTKNARSSLGICPQHNVLYDTLTTEEHLKIYAGLKGVKWGQLSQESSRILKLLDLEEKRNELSQSLSGGMKRKLSLGIAIIGGSRVLFLDEPTSGMDPEARRILWDILLGIRGDHTIVLTTHYMEEADILGDRIAIMADGKVQCCGSPLFLKKKYGTGYHIHMAQNPNCDINALTTFLQRYCPQTTLESSKDSLSLTYSLGGDAMGPLLCAMFQDLEAKKVELGVSSFGITVSTMDDVFLKVSMLAGGDLDKKDISNSETMNLNLESSEGQFLLQYEKLRSPKHLWMQQLASLLSKRYSYAKRQWGVLLFQAIIPIAMTCMFLAILRNAFSTNSGATDSLKLDLAYEYGDTEGVVNFKGKAFAFSDTYIPVVQEHGVKTTNADDPQAYALKVAKNNLGEFLKKLSVGGVGTNLDSKLDVTAWYNGEPYHILPMALNIMHVALLRYFTGDQSLSMTVINSPLPPSDMMDMNADTQTTFIRMLSCIFVPLILAFYSACYVLVPIHECSSRAKLLQLMSGISAFTYWMAMFIWDMLFHTIISLLLIVPFGIFVGYVFFPHPEAIGGVIAFLLLFGWSTFPICYLLSRVINKPASGFTLVLSFTVITGLILSIVMFTVELSVEDEHSIQIALYFLRFLPSFSVTRGMSNLMAISFNNTFCDRIPENILNIQCGLPQLKSQVAQCCKDTCGNHCFNKTYPITWDQHGCGREMFFLWLDGIIFFALLFFCETGLLTKAWTVFVTKLPWKKTGVAALAVGNTAEIIDNDVFEEADRIKNLISNTAESEALVVRELTKWYKGFCAVDSLTFGVHKEECFGLLGVNGAGKSSTFKMLTGDIFPTKGNAFIQNSSIQTNLKKFQSYIGYCPQYDALIDRLTGREILRLFASLRGISRTDVDNCVNSLITRVDLQEHADKPCKVYSGGNKRKLSLAMALIGTPPVIFLDEPTAGVDPVSRRKIWSVLEDARKITKSAVILCTHSMEECEALCSRLAIMVNGQFRCLGSIQHLKTKYGLGFTVIIKLKREQGIDNNMKIAIKTHFEQTFPSANLKDDHQGMFHYHITDAEISWSFLFKAVENMKQSFQFEDYLISGTTLEQIFLAFARGQRDTAEVI